MKSFMRNQPTHPSQAIKADKRFEALVKQEMREHQHIISSHNKEMQSLRDELRLTKERCESLSNRCEQELKDFKTYSVSVTGVLKVKLSSSEATIAEQKKTIEDLHRQMLSFQDNYSTRIETDIVKKAIEGKIAAATVNNIVSLQDFQREMKGLFNAITEELLKFKNNVDEKFFESKEKSENDYHNARLDKEGIERELIRYKKAVFYIEKKIENIYTLIERINKRGSLCPKQE